MTPNRKGWHYLAITKLPALLKGIKTKHHTDFYCLNFFAIGNKLKCTISGLRQFLAIGSFLQIIKALFFIQTLFVLKIFNFLP